MQPIAVIQALLVIDAYKIVASQIGQTALQLGEGEVDVEEELKANIAMERLNEPSLSDMVVRFVNLPAHQLIRRPFKIAYRFKRCKEANALLMRLSITSCLSHERA